MHLGNASNEVTEWADRNAFKSTHGESHIRPSSPSSSSADQRWQCFQLIMHDRFLPKYPSSERSFWLDYVPACFPHRV